MSKFESPSHEALLELMVAASHLRAQFDRVLQGSGISGEQYNILRILRGIHPEGHACGEIANRMIDRSPDITRRIDGLERQGLVERKRSDHDRRMVITRITQKGLELVDSLKGKLAEYDSNVAERLSMQDCADLSRICEKLFDDK